MKENSVGSVKFSFYRTHFKLPFYTSHLPTTRLHCWKKFALLYFQNRKVFWSSLLSLPLSKVFELAWEGDTLPSHSLLWSVLLQNGRAPDLVPAILPNLSLMLTVKYWPQRWVHDKRGHSWGLHIPVKWVSLKSVSSPTIPENCNIFLN